MNEYQIFKLYFAVVLFLFFFKLKLTFPVWIKFQERGLPYRIDKPG